MTARSILQVFDQYQKARLLFVQSIADFASKPNTIECLEAAGVLDLLCPLLTDLVPSIQHMAAVALGKIANNNHKLAQTIAALFVLRAIARHSPEFASMVIQSNGLDTIIICLEDFDSGVKEAAAWALGYIARHNKSLAQTTVDAGAVPLLVLSLQEPELCIKQITASALFDISKHSTELAENVVDAGAIPFLAKALSNPDTKLKRQVLLALSSIAKHSAHLAESIIEAEIFPDVLVHMAHPDECVVKAAAMLTREICKHTLEMAQLIVNIGGIGALVELFSTSKLTVRLPAIMAIGYIAGHSDQLAIAVIGSKGIVHLSTILHEENDDHTLAVTVWAIGQIGKHTSEHAKAVAVANILPKLLELYNNPNSSEDLKAKCNTALKQILQKCMYIEALEALLYDSPPNILKYVLGQFSKILPHDARARRLFVTSGGLKKVQEIQTDPGSTLFEYIQIINCCFPEEIIRLERIVFGDPSDIINNLPNDDSVKLNINKNNNDISISNDLNNDLSIQTDICEEYSKTAAWIDEDDFHYSIQDAEKAQNRKVADDVPEKLYKDFLCNKYIQLVGNPKWAKLEKIDKESDDLNNEILKHSNHLEKPKIKNLSKNKIDIKALSPINKQTHMEGPIISSVEFHPSSTVALVAGTSGILSLFQVDGIENNKLHSVQYKKFPISTAKFLRDGTEVLIGSQYYGHCHSYNLINGKTYKMQLPRGITNMQKYEVSPDGKLLAICGRSGEIFLLTTSSKEVISTLKMNAKCRALAFTPDSNMLITHGDSNEMYIWDVNNRICIHRAVDDGCLSCASIAMSPNGQFLATGSKEGVVNVYNSKTVLQNQNPVPLKIVLNFVTSITSLKFNSYSEILAMASDKKYNAFKMMHLPSFTVFSNFPTYQTKISMPQAIDFSPGSGYLAISNKSNTAFLYRLKHYGNY